MSALFVIMALVVATIAQMNYNDIADSFTKGCQDLLAAALSVGLAYSGIILPNSTHAGTGCGRCPALDVRTAFSPGRCGRSLRAPRRSRSVRFGGG